MSDILCFREDYLENILERLRRNLQFHKNVPVDERDKNKIKELEEKIYRYELALNLVNGKGNGRQRSGTTEDI